ncbi:four-carbon acid sugar kinase family protein, partial [Muricomes intestini]|uniref:four-carbon acid sugar kinase family protein n=1 Tax=Muricomes intestini TaxID=1796634 RepID=UPI002FDEC070
MNTRYLVVADDFTGSNDTGVQLRRRGYPTEVIFAGNVPGEDKSVVIDTESRTVRPDQAHDMVSNALKGIELSGFRYVIKKVDSTVRGNIPQEIRAVDEALKPGLIVFAPALPGLGRTTVNGVQRLDGVEICRTEISKDPRNPVEEDHLVKLLAREYQEPVILKELEEIRSGGLSFENDRIFVCDAETDADLKSIIKAAQETKKTVLYIGTAGIADNLMEMESPSLPALGVVASISTVTNRQMHYCEEKGYTMVKIPVHEILTEESKMDQYRDMAIAALARGEDTILLTNTSFDREEMEMSQKAGEKRGMNLTDTGEYVRSMMGRTAREILEAVPVSGVFLTGGDTALGVM